MARSAPAISAFTSGVLSPRLEGRITLEKYQTGLSDLTNMIVQPQGGVTRRPGTEFVCEVKTSSVKNRLIPFQFKTTDTYILVFGNQTMRVIRNGLQVLNSTTRTITAVTKANPGVITSNSHGYSNGDEIYIASVGGMTELNERNYRVANATTNTFTLTDLYGTAINTTNFTTYTSGGSVNEIFEVASPYTEADLPTVNFAQSADTLIWCILPMQSER